MKLTGGILCSEELAAKIRQSIRSGATPRHLPAIILVVDKISCTISSKNMELAVLEVIQGGEPKNKAALADASALDCYKNIPELGSKV